MSQDPLKSKSLLAPITTRYKPSPADFERISARIEASLEASSKGASASSSSSRLMRWAGLSCVALLVGGVAVRQMRASPPSVETPAPSPLPAAAALTHEEVRPMASAGAGPVGVPVVSVDALPLVPPRASHPVLAIKPAASSKPLLDDDTLARETRLLAEAESAFRRGDDPRALSSLDEHAKQFPNGLLKDERIAERIVVLCHSGRVDQATREGRAFLQNRASDPLARRVALSCAGGATSPTETP